MIQANRPSCERGRWGGGDGMERGRGPHNARKATRGAHQDQAAHPAHGGHVVGQPQDAGADDGGDDLERGVGGTRGGLSGAVVRCSRTPPGPSTRRQRERLPRPPARPYNRAAPPPPPTPPHVVYASHPVAVALVLSHVLGSNIAQRGRLDISALLLVHGSASAAAGGAAAACLHAHKQMQQGKRWGSELVGPVRAAQAPSRWHNLHSCTVACERRQGVGGRGVGLRGAPRSSHAASRQARHQRHPTPPLHPVAAPARVSKAAGRGQGPAHPPP